MPAAALSKANRQILACRYCRSQAIGKIVPGEGSASASLIIIGEAPGRNEAKTGRPFIGSAGKVLRTLLSEVGISEKDTFITSIVKYLPEYVTPRQEDIAHGSLHTSIQLKALRPRLIIMLGRFAGEGILGRPVALSSEHGELFRWQKIPALLTYHPAAILYARRLLPELKKDFRKAARLLAKSQAVAKGGRAMK